MYTKVNVKDLKIPAINWLIAQYEGENTAPNYWHLHEYATNYNDGIPIVEREGILLMPKAEGGYLATKSYDECEISQSGPNIIMAGLLCVIAIQYGDEVHIPTTLA